MPASAWTIGCSAANGVEGGRRVGPQRLGVLAEVLADAERLPLPVSTTARTSASPATWFSASSSASFSST